MNQPRLARTILGSLKRSTVLAISFILVPILVPVVFLVGVLVGVSLPNPSNTKKPRLSSIGGVPSGAKDEVRTRDLNLGKVALYQLSYFRLLFVDANIGSFQLLSILFSKKSQFIVTQ